MEKNQHITHNISEHPGPILTYCTGLVVVLVGMIIPIFVWRSAKGRCYGDQLNLGDVCRRCAKRPLLFALEFDNALADCQAVFKCSMAIGRVSYIRIYLCYFCFRWKTVSLVQASMQHLMHHVTVSLQQSKITLQNYCINNTSITQPTLSFYWWLKM